ncbi:Polyketide biosynthesis dithiol-disulfide isomerase [Candidatus Terasakiella magnetica]|uniref:Polyketide biosynthesis dithiol-disulfide isomerase n=1 Tax=Candidatus Terasakiella magnetica TaxID=1867952 RepID=A0A1C3RC25_9PROT|nr:DsbA family oxidoreductase [Candidatus Terasakiella magnetica]SCA54815.1 Polyketide biosynthesis dithiol-disulfide isomerase [Candidatus Terasakiella magnetica]
MYIDIYYDTICPWCLIGKKRLEQALESRGHVSLKARWRPFLLNPSMAPQGMDRQTYLEQKFGGPQRAKRVYDVIAQTGHENGIDFQFDKIQYTPNSIDSHRLVYWAENFDLESKMVDRLFQAFFIEGQNIGDQDVLIELAGEVGLNKDDCLLYLDGDEDYNEVIQSDREARELGVHGVPAFVARDRYIISGAQEAKILGKFIDTAWNG